MNDKMDSRFSLLTLLGISVTVPGLISCQKVNAQPPNAPLAQKKKMNVLFIVSDDLNCDLGAYGHYMVKTPNIDRLAAEGMLFKNAYCNFPQCGPSRASLLTGLYPDQSTMLELTTLVRDRLPDVTTLPQNFTKNGYVAARVGKIYHAGNPGDIGTPGSDDPDSWQITVNPRGIDKNIEDQIQSLRPGSRSFGATVSWLAAEGTDEEHTDGIVTTTAIGLLKEFAENETPFFLGVGLYKPHTPFVAPKKYFDMYPKDQIIVPDYPADYFETLPEPAKVYLTRFPEQNNLPKDVAQTAIQAYYACISFVDANVGRLLDALDELGLRDNTIIVFFGDHGYHMGEHNYFQKLTLFENSDRAPLIISYPAQKTKGQETNSLVEFIDIYPTLSELAGISYPSYVSGKSMIPILQDPETRIRESAITRLIDGYTIRTEDFRYTRWLEGGEGMIEFYDRRNDPEEMVNMANSPEYQNLILEYDQLLQNRIDEASVPPEGITVIPPDVKPSGVYERSLMRSPGGGPGQGPGAPGQGPGQGPGAAPGQGPE